jgi:hypothetical protein
VGLCFVLKSVKLLWAGRDSRKEAVLRNSVKNGQLQDSYRDLRILHLTDVACDGLTCLKIESAGAHRYVTVYDHRGIVRQNEYTLHSFDYYL